MNTLKDICELTKLNYKQLGLILGFKESTLKNTINRTVNELKVSQLIDLHNSTNLSYNKILGENIFTEYNINIKELKNIRETYNEEYFKELIDKILSEKIRNIIT